MSTLRTNSLEGVDAKNSITIVAGAGNVTTTNVQEGLAKMWHRSSDAASPTDSFNVSGGTDNGTGDFTYAFTNNMANANFGQAHIINDTNAGSINSSAQATSSTRIEIINGDGSAARDRINAGQLHGDLA
tara:strand:+ start:1053 stop:1442 length:390 start_codon:yes stop_codon:yes gene_type:complete